MQLTPNERKIMGIAIIALLFSLIIYYEDTSRHIQLNNTDLCQWNGTACAGYRAPMINYTASSDMEIMVMSEINGANKECDLELYLNGVMVDDQDYITGPASTDVDHSINMIIPKGAKYRVVHSTRGSMVSIKWYEYKYI
jgi:hypothetical protein